MKYSGLRFWAFGYECDLGHFFLKKSPRAKPMLCLIVGVNLANIYIVIVTQANEMCGYEGDLG